MVEITIENSSYMSCPLHKQYFAIELFMQMFELRHELGIVLAPRLSGQTQDYELDGGLRSQESNNFSEEITGSYKDLKGDRPILALGHCTIPPLTCNLLSHCAVCGP